METLITRLEKETQELKASYLTKTSEWAKGEFIRLKKWVADYRANYDVNKEKAYYRLPACVINMNGKESEFVEIQMKRAIKHYQNSIEKLAARIIKKGLNTESMSLSTSYLDPNISTTITDGNITIRAFTIIASGPIQRPHYRYLIK